MKTKVQNTSLEAYFGEILPDLGRRQAEVLEVFTRGNYTNTELASVLNLPINSITPRVFELRRLNLLEEDIVRVCKSTGRKAKVWKLKSIYARVSKLPGNDFASPSRITMHQSQLRF